MGIEQKTPGLWPGVLYCSVHCLQNRPQLLGQLFGGGHDEPREDFPHRVHHIRLKAQAHHDRARLKLADGLLGQIAA